MKTIHLLMMMTLSLVTSRSIAIPPSIIANKNSLTMYDRTPIAISNSVQVSFQSFFSNSAIMIPLCLIAGAFHKHPSRNIWFQKSLASGVEWGVIASIFSGGEELMKILRDKDDIWNRSIASGIASGLVQIKDDGPKGFVIGFAQGFGFLFVLDQVTNNLPPPPPSSTSTQGSSTSSSTSSIKKNDNNNKNNNKNDNKKSHKSHKS